MTCDHSEKPLISSDEENMLQNGVGEFDAGAKDTENKSGRGLASRLGDDNILNGPEGSVVPVIKRELDGCAWHHPSLNDPPLSTIDELACKDQSHAHTVRQ